MPDPLIITEYDVKDSNLLLRYLRRVGERVLSLDERLGKAEKRPTGITTPEVVQNIQANGRSPLRVDNLGGVLREPQLAKVPVYATDPTGQILQNLYPDQLVVVGTTSTGDRLYRVIGGNPNTLRQINPAISGATVSVADDQFTIYDNGNNTRIIRFEAGSITAGNTRVMTVPDTDQILAGRDVNNLFSTNQTIIRADDASTILLTRNTNSTGTAAAARVQAFADVADNSLFAHGTARTFTRCGIVMGGWNELRETAGNGFLIDTVTAVPLVFGTNDVERMRFSSTGLATFITPGQCILVKPSTSPAANTIMMELQSTTAASLWSVDVEGDQINRTLKLVGAVADTLLIQPASASGGAELFRIKDTGGTEGVSMRDDGFTQLTGSSAGLDINNSGFAGTLAIEISQSGTQTSSITNDGAIQCDLNIAAGTAITAGTSIQAGTSVTATSTAGFRFPSNVFWRSGSGSPEGVVPAVVGSLWSRTDGGTATTLYVKELGTSSTGWAAK